jgi:hypothetical protein
MESGDAGGGRPRFLAVHCCCLLLPFPSGFRPRRLTFFPTPSRANSRPGSTPKHVAQRLQELAVKVGYHA